MKTIEEFVTWAESIGWQEVQNPSVRVDPEDPAFTVGRFIGRDDHGLLHHVQALSATGVEGSWRLEHASLSYAVMRSKQRVRVREALQVFRTAQGIVRRVDAAEELARAVEALLGELP